MRGRSPQGSGPSRASSEHTRPTITTSSFSSELWLPDDFDRHINEIVTKATICLDLESKLAARVAPEIAAGAPLPAPTVQHLLGTKRVFSSESYSGAWFGRQVAAWLRGDGPPLSPLDDVLDEASATPYFLQRKFNLVLRLGAMQPSPDKVDQLYRSGDTITSFHVTGNLQILPWILNQAKSDGINEVIQLILLALHLHQAGMDVGCIAALLCRLAPLERASCSRSCADELRGAWIDDLKAFRAFLNGANAQYDWVAVLPEPDIESTIFLYAATNVADEAVLNLMENSATWADEVRTLETLWQQRRPGAVPLLWNAEGFPTLMFPAYTPTFQIVKLVCCIVRRARIKCDKRHAPDIEEFSELGVLLHLAVHVLESGYVRSSGVTGTIDKATGLPHCYAGISHHPLNVSFCAHRNHGRPMVAPASAEAWISSSAVINVEVELWAINRFRSSFRTSALLHALQTMTGPLQSLLDCLTIACDIAPRKLPREFQMRTDLWQSWRHNNLSPLELVLSHPGLLPRLQQLSKMYGLNKTAQEHETLVERQAYRIGQLSRAVEEAERLDLCKFDPIQEAASAVGFTPAHATVTRGEPLSELAMLVADADGAASTAPTLQSLPDYRLHTCLMCKRVVSDPNKRGDDGPLCATCNKRALREQREAGRTFNCEDCPAEATRAVAGKNLCEDCAAKPKQFCCAFCGGLDYERRDRRKGYTHKRTCFTCGKDEEKQSQCRKCGTTGELIQKHGLCFVCCRAAFVQGELLLDHHGAENDRTCLDCGAECEVRQFIQHRCLPCYRQFMRHGERDPHDKTSFKCGDCGKIVEQSDFFVKNKCQACYANDWRADRKAAKAKQVATNSAAKPRSVPSTAPARTGDISSTAGKSQASTGAEEPKDDCAVQLDENGDAASPRSLSGSSLDPSPAQRQRRSKRKAADPPAPPQRSPSPPGSASWDKCIKCKRRAPVIIKKHGLCKPCYNEAYNAGRIAKKPAQRYCEDCHAAVAAGHLRYGRCQRCHKRTLRPRRAPRKTHCKDCKQEADKIIKDRCRTCYNRAKAAAKAAGQQFP